MGNLVHGAIPALKVLIDPELYYTASFIFLMLANCSAEPARRNTFVSFSILNDTGMVGCLLDLKVLTSSIRSCRALLSGSMDKQNLPFNDVYSWPQ